jgi:hypothetical protein
MKFSPLFCFCFLIICFLINPISAQIVKKETLSIRTLLRVLVLGIKFNLLAQRFTKFLRFNKSDTPQYILHKLPIIWAFNSKTKIVNHEKNNLTFILFSAKICFRF